jgi:hypothetical protein
MMDISEPWFEVQTYSLRAGWVGECLFNTLEEAKVWAEKNETNNSWQIVQCFVVYKGGVK